MLRCFTWPMAIVTILAIVGSVEICRGEKPQIKQGTIQFRTLPSEKQVPKQFHLENHTFAFSQEMVSDAESEIEVSRVTFASPVKTPHKNNNTVHCEYFHLKNDRQPRPGVIVLHILGGDFALSRLFCVALARKNVAALFVKMPYYGPRRHPGVNVRMISEDPRQTVRGMTQAVLDIRRATAWLAARKEVDENQLGIFGISLGGITASVAGPVEPRIKKICPMLAGGGMAQVAWESRELSKLRRYWTAQGGNKESLLELLKPIDPLTHAASARGRQILMINAKRDEVIPRRCTDALWREFGRPKIVWYDAGHYSAARFLLNAVKEVTTFFQPGAVGKLKVK